MATDRISKKVERKNRRCDCATIGSFTFTSEPDQLKQKEF